MNSKMVKIAAFNTRILYFFFALLLSFILLLLELVIFKQLDSKTERVLRCLFAEATWQIKKRCNYIIINVFRNDFECSYVFAIALPFSIRSLTYTNGYFYAIRDDGDPGASTLFRISETDLIGGYVYWHQMAQKQCESCLPSDRPISFDLGNYEETCTM